jgi:transcriptional regulator with XRE-family HTH domain
MRDTLRLADMSRTLAANLMRLIGATTQQEIADKVGISRSALNNILQGKVDPRLSTAQALADVLGVSISELTGEAPNGERPLSKTAMRIARVYDALEPEDQAVVKRFFSLWFSDTDASGR